MKRSRIILDTNIKPEVLSPVGNRDMLTCAVRSGADAVYLGVTDFNARRNAANFSLDDLKEAVEYCHICGVKVYLTLNTLLSDTELPRAADVAGRAYNLGVDAVITADLGLAKILHKYIPSLPLHASTQMTVHTPECLPILKELGFTRVVVSREMEKSEMAEFVKKALSLGIETEVFVHGALCMCMSGQCYLSAMLGGRSGNRGLCAGPCRLPFSSPNGTGYDLSLKDLSLVPNISELAEMGVASLKIEGRMKRPEYVAAATATVRKAVDKEDIGNLYDMLCRVFSRSGFTDAHYTGNRGRSMFGVRTNDDAALTASVVKSLHELYRNEYKRVALTGSFTAKKDREITLSVTDGVNSAIASGDVPQIAKNRPIDREYALSQLSKTGGTPYYFTDIVTDIDDGISVSAGAMNNLRRKVIEELSKKRTAVNTVNYSPEYIIPDRRKGEGKLCLRLYDLSQLPDNLSGIYALSFPIESNFENLLSNRNFESTVLTVELPRAIVNTEFIKERLSAAKKCGIKYAVCENLSALQLVKDAGLCPVMGFASNLFNSQSVALAKEMGVCACILSAELKCDMINAVGSSVPTGYIAYGRLPLMLTRACPVKNGRDCINCKKDGVLTDRKGITFPVKCRLGYSEIFNSKPIYLADRQDEFNTDFAVLYMTTENKNEVENIIDAYKNHRSPNLDYTRGLYWRGVE